MRQHNVLNFEREREIGLRDGYLSLCVCEIGRESECDNDVC